MRRVIYCRLNLFRQRGAKTRAGRPLASLGPRALNSAGSLEGGGATWPELTITRHRVCGARLAASAQEGCAHSVRLRRLRRARTKRERESLNSPGSGHRAAIDFDFQVAAFAFHHPDKISHTVGAPTSSPRESRKEVGEGS